MRIIYLDLETTGVPPEDVHICQIGALRGDGSVLYDQLLRLPEGVEVSLEAQEVNGLTAEILNHPGTAEPAGSFFTDLELYLSSEPFALAGHNLWRYDWPVLKANALRYGFELPDPTALIDTKLLYAAWLLGLRRDVGHDTIQEWYAWVSLHARSVTCDLDTLARIIGVELPRSNHHDALQDARITMAVCAAMRERGMLEPVLELEA